MLALALALSVTGLMVGPALFAWARGRSLAVAALDGATLGVVPALLLLRILPHLVEEVGVVALVALVAGYLAYLLIESRGHHHAAEVGLALVVPTLAVHSFLDGAGLALAFSRGAGGAAGAALGAALVIHKVPEGLFLASRFGAAGTRGAFLRVAGLGATTVLGGLTGRELLAHTSDNALHVVVAVGLGVMLRMVVHRHDEPAAAAPERATTGAAFLLSVIPVVMMPSPLRLLDRSQPHELSAAQALVPLFLESSPWLLAVLVVSELAQRGRRSAKLRQPSAWMATTALLTVLLGPVFAAVRGFLDLLIRGIAARRLALSTWREDLAPRAAEVLPSYGTGVVLSVAAEAALPRGVIDIPTVAAVPAAVMASFLVPVGPAGAAVLATILVHKGAPIPAGLSFMLARTATAAASSWRGRITVLLVVCVAATLAAQVVELSESPSLHELGAHRHALHEWLSAVALAVWMAIELVRQGPRAWFDVAFSRTTAVDHA